VFSAFVDEITINSADPSMCFGDHGRDPNPVEFNEVKWFSEFT
jgi:hypothetical protein